MEQPTNKKRLAKSYYFHCGRGSMYLCDHGRSLYAVCPAQWTWPNSNYDSRKGWRGQLAHLYGRNSQTRLLFCSSGSPTSYAYKPPSEERKAVIDLWSSDPKGNLRRVIEQAQGSPNAIPVKAAVIGFSMGGGGALAYAASMPDLVSAVAAFYPQTKNIACEALPLNSKFQSSSWPVKKTLI
jgi:pimeloyl-ACP methyl ester carboxylesterase